jgi:hypothetical protein
LTAAFVGIALKFRFQIPAFRHSTPRKLPPRIAAGLRAGLLTNGANDALARSPSITKAASAFRSGSETNDGGSGIERSDSKFSARHSYSEYIYIQKWYLSKQAVIFLTNDINGFSAQLKPPSSCFAALSPIFFRRQPDAKTFIR